MRPSWHISPRIDALSYHWSWLPVFVVLQFFGPTFPTDYLVVALPLLGLNFAHQALTILLVYGDKEVFGRDARRLTVLPGLLLVGFLSMLALWKRKWAPGTLSPADCSLAVGAALVLLQTVVVSGGGLTAARGPLFVALVAAVPLWASWSGLVPALSQPAAVLVLLAALAALSVWMSVSATDEGAGPARRNARILVPAVLVLALGLSAIHPSGSSPLWPTTTLKARTFMVPLTAIAHLWNLWHFYRQKFGILRMYAAKSGVPADRAVPPRIDEWLVFGWLPLLAVWVGPAHGALIVAQYRSLKGPLLPILDVLSRHQSWLLPLAALFLIGSLAAWTRAEWRASRLRNTARVSAALGLSVLGACIFFIDPVKGVVALGFSHILEYLVFVWAFERRYYATPRETFLARWMRHPGWTVFGVAAVLMVVHIYVSAWGKHIALSQGRPEWFGITAGRLLGSVGIFLSMFHFYVDGFVWKMRRPEVRTHL